MFVKNITYVKINRHDVVHNFNLIAEFVRYKMQYPPLRCMEYFFNSPEYVAQCSIVRAHERFRSGDLSESSEPV